MRTIRMLTRIVKDHHQGRPESPFETEAKQEVDSSEDYNKNISDMIAFICDLYPFTYFSVTGCENLFCQILSGILRFSDWAASSYCDFLTSDSKQYKENCEKMAERFCGMAGYWIRRFQILGMTIFHYADCPMICYIHCKEG